MSELGEMYRDWNKIKNERKSENRVKIMQLLCDYEIPFEPHNFELHIIITLNGKRIDVWPTTNKAKIGNNYIYNAYDFLLSQIKKSNKL